MEEYKYKVGDRVRILDGIRRGQIREIEECRMSSGYISVPTYYIKGSWYFEWELESV